MWPMQKKCKAQITVRCLEIKLNYECDLRNLHQKIVIQMNVK